MNIIAEIEEIHAEGWQVQSVWIVPPTSHVSLSCEQWEAHVKIADMVPLGEADGPIKITVDQSKIPDGVRVMGREKMPDRVVTLPPMSDEQADAIASAIHEAGDASATHKTASGCWSIGPTAAWCSDPLRSAILNSRKP